ncbi:MAG: fluoride efflux transporter CrcB [Aeromonas sp.]
MSYSLHYWALIAGGGALGACLRFALSEATALWLGRAFPFGTLLVNVLGSAVMGAAYAWLLQPHAPAVVKPLLMVGLLGALTTFSSFTLDNLVLLEQGQLTNAALNMALNLGLCLLAAWSGLTLARL